MTTLLNEIKDFIKIRNHDAFRKLTLKLDHSCYLFPVNKKMKHCSRYNTYIYNGNIYETIINEDGNAIIKYVETYDIWSYECEEKRISIMN